MPAVAVEAVDTLTLVRPPADGAVIARPRRPERATRALWVFSAAGIGLSSGIMAAVSLAGPSRAVVSAGPASAAPPWWIPLHPSETVVTLALWAAAALGGGGVLAGLAAVARGGRPSVRLLLGAAVGITMVLTVLLPAGSSDTLDYAAYGRITATGHSPYVMTPLDLRNTGDPIGRVAPNAWEHSLSVYGPAATAEEAVAAELGGSSPAAVLLWLKLLNSLAFLAVVGTLDLLLRHDPARRARAHLLWSVNPLLLWGLVAGGHVDALAAALGLLGVLLITAGGLRAPGAVWRGLAAGALIGLAADVKITFAVFGLGAAWGARRFPKVVLAAAGGAIAVLAPSYLVFGLRAVMALVARRAAATSDNFYQLAARLVGAATLPGLTLVAGVVFAAVGALLLRRLPDRAPDLPALQPALALALAWLLTWPYQRPWYDALALCLLAVYPASRFDGLMLLRLLGVTVYYLPGMPGLPRSGWLGGLNHWESSVGVPVLRITALVVAALFCLPWVRQARLRRYLRAPVALR